MRKTSKHAETSWGYYRSKDFSRLTEVARHAARHRANAKVQGLANVQSKHCRHCNPFPAMICLLQIAGRDESLQPRGACKLQSAKAGEGKHTFQIIGNQYLRIFVLTGVRAGVRVPQYRNKENRQPQIICIMASPPSSSSSSIHHLGVTIPSSGVHNPPARNQ